MGWKILVIANIVLVVGFFSGSALVVVIGAFMGVLGVFFAFFREFSPFSNSVSNSKVDSSDIEDSESSNPDPADFKKALAELESGKFDEAIWAQAYTQAQDEEQTRRLYVKFRAEALASAYQREKPSIWDGLGRALSRSISLALLFLLVIFLADWAG